MFIVLGRLGCKQVICLGYVYVLWLFRMLHYTHLCRQCCMLLRSFHFGSSTLLDPSRIILKKQAHHGMHECLSHRSEVPSLVKGDCSETTSPVEQTLHCSLSTCPSSLWTKTPSTGGSIGQASATKTKSMNAAMATLSCSQVLLPF